MTRLSSVGVRELRQDASKLLLRVQLGETIQITDHGKPVAILTQVPTSPYEQAIASGLIEAPRSTKSIKDIKPVKGSLPGTSLDRLLADRAAE